jgi:hypothetical protein
MNAQRYCAGEDIVDNLSFGVVGPKCSLEFSKLSSVGFRIQISKDFFIY